MRRSFVPWRFDCADCGFLAADLESGIGSDASHPLNEKTRAEALLDLRRRNFRRILDRMDVARLPGRDRLLDVGCAHGWFLDLARERGYRAEGIEPDPEIARLARDSGHDVVDGFFPDDIDAGKRYDVIVFNDVLEHLADPRRVVAQVRDRSTERGLLVVNLPSSKGIVFRTAAALARLGIHGPHDRMWQVGFPSPHVSYFHPAGLARLVESEGFAEIDRGVLPLFEVSALWKRIRYDRTLSLPAATATCIGLGLIAPLGPLMAADITYQIFQRQ